MTKDEIIIRNAIIHILDSSVGMPVLSEQLLPQSQDLYDLIRGHIFRIASGDDLKHCVFDTGETEEERVVYQLLQNFEEENLISFSQEIASYLYTIMNENIDIPAADFLVVTYQVNSTPHMAMLKLNYKDSFVHMTGKDEDGSHFNDIIKQTATLPSAGARLSEAVLIDLSDFSVDIVEKKYEVNGIKTNYLSEMFLKCHAKMSQKTKMNIVTKAVDQINKKYFEDDFDKKMEAKSIIQNEIAESGTIQVETISEKIYGDLPEVKEEFTEKLEKYHMADARIVPQSETTTKKFTKQFIKTDTGIEINIPMEQYNDKDNVEFITNPDGTISIMIKNINHITTR